MPTAPINGIQLYYEIHGEGPSTIVFAHGAAGNHLVWFQQIPFFSKRYRCITFDHRRFHLSPDMPDGPGVAAFVDDLAALLDYLKVQETAIVAQSMAGMTGFGFALAHPRRVKALVMSGTVQGIPSAAIREISAKLRTQHPDVGTTDGNYSISFPEREPALDFLYREITTLNNGYGKQQLRATTPPPPPDSDITKLTAPVLFLFGSEDAVVPPDVRRLAHSLIPGSKMVEVEGSGHSVYFERANDFNRIVSKFLNDIGEYDEARKHYQDAIKACTETRFRPGLAQTRLLLAELLLEHYPAEKKEALEHLDFAIKEFREMKMQPSLERALRHKNILKA